jgi:hypothetical protein
MIGPSAVSPKTESSPAAAWRVAVDGLGKIPDRPRANAARTGN